MQILHEQNSNQVPQTQQIGLPQSRRGAGVATRGRRRGQRQKPRRQVPEQPREGGVVRLREAVRRHDRAAQQDYRAQHEMHRLRRADVAELRPNQSRDVPDRVRRARRRRLRAAVDVRQQRLEVDMQYAVARRRRYDA